MQPDTRLPGTPTACDAARDVAGTPGLPIRADLAATTPYGAPQVDVPIRLNTNENPYPPPPAFAAELAEEVRAAAAGLNRYPDRDATALRAELAGYLTAATGAEISTAQVWAANGSNEIIQQLLQAFGGPGRTALGFAPSYSMHPRIAAATGTGWVDAARDASFGLDADRAAAAVRAHRPDVVFLTSPNNPTGTALPPDVVAAVADAAPGMVVVDEAYAEFARPGTASAVTLLPGRPRLVVTRTMSKAFALAGARVGYLAADPAVREALLLVRLPYHLSSPTQLVARAALRHRGELLAAVGRLRGERDALVDWLRGRGHAVADSDANFVLFGAFADRTLTWRGLLARGVLVREVGPPGWLRVSVGTPEEMAAFRSALSEVAGAAGAGADRARADGAAPEPEEER